MEIEGGKSSSLSFVSLPTGTPELTPKPTRESLENKNDSLLTARAERNLHDTGMKETYTTPGFNSSHAESQR